MPVLPDCAVDKKMTEISESVAEVLKQQMAAIYGSSDAGELNKEYLASHGHSHPHRLAGL